MAKIEIINGDHVPPHAFMIVDRVGMHVDLSTVRGELFDQSTTAKVEWGILHPGTGKLFGRVILKNGQSRVFWDAGLMQPYLAAYLTRWMEEKTKHETNMAKRAADKLRHLQKRGVDQGMVRAARAQVEQELARG